jgi:hypothetical protein
MSDQYDWARGARPPVDLDLLADYVAGALEPSEQRAVAAAIARDPDWARAHEAVAAADQSMRAQLHAYARSRIEPMPGDVAARVDDAWRTLAASEPPRARTARIHVKPRRTRWAGLAAAAAAAVALVGGGVALGQFSARTNNASTGAAGGNPHAPEAATDSRGGGANNVGTPKGSALTFGTSGLNYTADTLYLLATTQLSPATAVPVGGQEVPAYGSDSAKTLSAPMNACLVALTNAHPGTIERVDSARFNGSPALVVLILEASAGTPAVARQLVVAVGPQCGTNGADELANQLVP